MEKLSYTKNTQVIMDFDDGSCHIEEHEVTKVCFNPFTAINYFIIKETKGVSDTCPYLPTRLRITRGKFLTSQNGLLVFLSDQDKCVFQLLEKFEICGCMESWRTNYESIYLRKTGPCSILTPSYLPPSAINAEHSINLKMDYVMFKIENTSRVFYKNLYKDISETQFRNFRHFIQLARKMKGSSLFEIQKPIFARLALPYMNYFCFYLFIFRLRGEIISLIRCEARNFTVIETVQFCTRELAVSQNNKTVYMQYGSRVVQPYFQRVDCEEDGLGDVIQAQKDDGGSVYIMQQQKVIEFQQKVNFIEDEPLLTKAPIDLESQLKFTSFNESGIYDPSFIKAKNGWLLRGQQYAAMEHGITTSFAKINDWEKTAKNGINFFDFIEESALINFLYGDWLWRGMMEFLRILSYISGLHLLCTSGKKLLRKYLRIILGIKRDEKITRKMLRFGKKNDFTKEDMDRSWIQIMNENDELPPYNFYV